MTKNRRFFSLLTGTAMLVFYCTADRLPPVTDLSVTWVDPFVVNLSWSWQSPNNLPQECQIIYEIHLLGQEKEAYNNKVRITSKKYCTHLVDFDHLSYTVNAIIDPSTINSINETCRGWDNSETASINVNFRRWADIVKDFKCVVDPKGMNCSWIPQNPSLDLKLSYRICGESEAFIKSLKHCTHPYKNGTRNGCYLNVTNETDVCIHVNNTDGERTLKPILEVPPPKLTIKEEKGYLNLLWEKTKVGQNCMWFELCYEKCSLSAVCVNITNFTHTIPYDKNCLYKFTYRGGTDKYCPVLTSEKTTVLYGRNEPRDQTLTVIAIVIPVIVFLCVIVSCYCFKKHSHIICPTIPDPSVIFKEMMMNGNKQNKSICRENVYTPVPDVIEHFNVAEVSPIQQHS